MTGRFITGNGGGLFSGDYNDLTNKPSIPTSAYNYFAIWAEESADMVADAFQWSFGNGNDSPDGMGVVVPFACQLIGVSLSTEGAVSCSVEVRKNATSTGKSASKTDTKNGYNYFENSPVNFAAGDAVNFRTLTGNTGSEGCVATAWFRKEVTL